LELFKMQPSSRLESVPISAVRKLLPYSNTAKSEGVKVFHLNIGDPDVKTPTVMIDALKNWTEPVIRYAPSQGTPEFVKACLTYYHRLGFNFLESADIVVGEGASEILAWCFFGCCEAGDEVLTFEPFYSNYNAIAAFTGVTITSVPTSLKNGFHLPSEEEIVKRITPKTKAILFTNPGNPTGTVYRVEEVELLVKIAKERNLFLMSDEPYREYAFDSPAVTLLSYMQQLPDHIIILDSLSKRYSLCGARLGMLVTKNKKIVSGSMKLAMARLSGGLVDQVMGSKLVEVTDDYIKEVIQEYKRRRDLLYSELSKIEGVEVPIPEGAFYSMVKLPVEDAEHFATWLLSTYRDRNETVMLAPGEGFYSTKGSGKDQVRIAYVLNCDDLRRCVELIKGGLEKYKQSGFH